jgi:hypothetical protein
LTGAEPSANEEARHHVYDQSISWTLYEAVTFNDTRITSVDWASYPILRFRSVPDSVAVHVVDRPGAPFLGTGEAAQVLDEWPLPERNSQPLVIEGSSLAANSVAPGLRLAADDRVWIDFDQARLHLFDGRTEQALAPDQ